VAVVEDEEDKVQGCGGKEAGSRKAEVDEVLWAGTSWLKFIKGGARTLQCDANRTACVCGGVERWRTE